MSKTAKIPYQGEIWLVEFPKAKESRKPRRPCVVISNDEQNIYDEEVIVLPLTYRRSPTFWNSRGRPPRHGIK